MQLSLSVLVSRVAPVKKIELARGRQRIEKRNQRFCVYVSGGSLKATRKAPNEEDRGTEIGGLAQGIAGGGRGAPWLYIGREPEEYCARIVRTPAALEFSAAPHSSIASSPHLLGQ